MSQFHDTPDEDSGAVEAVEIEEPAQTQDRPTQPRIELSPADFLFGRTLGEGAFARVVHAQSKRTGADFAIKIMEKRHIKKENKTKHVIMERRVLTMVSHPLVVKFHFAFQDPDYLFMCMELVPGGVLLDVILSKLHENEARGETDVACDLPTTQFYIAEILTALEYLHDLDILHRDLKPENVLLDARGHIKIADFGTAAICSENQSPRTSFVGTQDYVSPEVLTGEKTATPACDLWALGCILFQMLTGRSPFHAATEFLTFERIMAYSRGDESLSFPPSVRDSPHAQSLVEQLLSPDERLRLTSTPDVAGYGSLKEHAFFGSLDLSRMTELQPPFVPAAVALTRPGEMKDGAGTDWLLDADPTPITATYHLSDVAAGSSATPNTGRWTRFMREGESPVFSSEIYKTVGLFSKKRRLILTDTPRLIYIDPQSLELKGEIPWTKAQPVSVSASSADKFEVLSEVTRRVYYLASKDVGSEAWVQQISAALARQRSLSISLR